MTLFIPHDTLNQLAFSGESRAISVSHYATFYYRKDTIERIQKSYTITVLKKFIKYSALNILAIPVCSVIHGTGLMLGMGIFGAVLATGMAPLISMLILSPHKFKKRTASTSVKSVLSLGFSSFVSEISSGIVIIVFNLIILRLPGNVGVAAYGVAANLSLVVISIFTGISQGMWLMNKIRIPVFHRSMC